jgi:regulator of protease activity HflC (stomatin/prohibitin superfamily)
MPSKAQIITSFGIFLLIVVGFKSYEIVEAGHVGVVRTLGAVQTKALPEGFSLKKPFIDKVEQMDVRLNRSTANAASSSRDLQNVQTQVTIQFALKGEIAPLTYQRLGGITEVRQTIIEPAIQESVKAITARYTAEQLVTQRAEVKLQIQEAIQRFIRVTLSDKGIETALNIANVAITNFEFSREFNQAIESKVKAEQEALQAKNEKLRRVTQAEAAEAEQKLSADAAAYQIEKESVARAEAIRREAEALKDNPQLISLRIAEKWNGQLPTFAGGDSIPLINFQDIK